MPDIMMDTESTRILSKELESATNELHSIIQRLSSNVRSVVGSSWISPRADQFQSQFEISADKIRRQILELEDLRRTLEVESARWEATSKQM